jgi:hypothetical protein
MSARSALAALAALATAALLVPAGAVLPAAADDLPPRTTHTTTGPRGGDGWFTGPATVHLRAEDPDGVARTEYRVDGGPWQVAGPGEEVIFDGTQASLDRWRQAGPGRFRLTPQGTLVTTGGLGMLWYPVEYGDAVLRFQWRDLKPALAGASNSGVFVRFPDVDEAAARAPEDRFPCQTGAAETQPAWVAINCGHEIQIYDGTTGEPQKTGSVYNFSALDLARPPPGGRGEWQDYEVRVEGDGDYTTTIVRNGEVLQTWTNSPGQTSSRSGDAPTELRHFATGHFGLQNHGSSDSVEFRDIRVERLDGGPAVRVTGEGEHTVEYRSVDSVGNVEATRVAHLRIDTAAPTVTATAEGGALAVTADDTLEGAGVEAFQYRVDAGPWVTVPHDEVLFDGTAETFDRWRMVGPGSFELTDEGNMRTVGGLGMLWYPERELGDVAVQLQWRDAREDGRRSNGGVFVRFPDPEQAVALPPTTRHPCQLGLGLFLAEWVAIQCGHEVQVNDADVDPKKTGSVYNFRDLDVEQARYSEFGAWNDYEVRTVGGGSYDLTVVRNGEVINRFANTPGQRPARAFDPPTDLRQFASGYLGLQNHGGEDTIEYRDVRVIDLGPATTTIPVPAGARTVHVRAVDAAGNVQAAQPVSVS